MNKSSHIQKSLSGLINWVGISVILSGGKNAIRQKYSLKYQKIATKYHPAMIELVEFFEQWTEKWIK